MKKTMSKKIVAIMVCTAALAGIYGGPVYAESLYKGNLSDIVYVKGGSTGFPRITDLDLDKVTIDGTNGSITINGQKIQTDNMNNIYVNTGLHTTGQITVDDNLSVSRNATVKGTLAVGTDGGQFIVGENGAISAAGGNFSVAADGATAVKSTLDAEGKSTLKGGLEVTGGATTDTLSVTGAATAGSLNVTNNAAVGGGLNVTGGTTTDTLTVTGNSNLQGDLTVTGDSKLNGKLEVTDKATLKGGLNVAGGTTTDTLTVTGDSKLNGKLEVDGTFSAAEGNFFVAADGATDIAANLNVKDDIVSEGGDVKIKDKNTNEIKLSDLGYLGDLDQELTAHSEYNGTAVGAFNAEAAIRRGKIARLDNRIDELDTRVNKVGAMAAAIAYLKSIGYSPEAPTEFSVGVGQYKGKTGIALGFFHYPNKDFMLNFSMSSSSGEMMGGIGATWRFGKAKG
ncbi:YadA-like family protein [Phascolarctobacterium succinatutens]|uniref:YadA-like family protein n=2 Tax=Phascolarctobacterium succinatutens TaxID=626940 RepID=UPI00267041B3|nr:YadA-like family protein [Phascolarctobacterium succinatutens]